VEKAMKKLNRDELLKVKGGDVTPILRNPWGSGEPPVNP
jgi:hypothetical protein